MYSVYQIFFTVVVKVLVFCDIFYKMNHIKWLHTYYQGLRRGISWTTYLRLAIRKQVQLAAAAR